MQAVAATAIDVAKEFQSKITGFPVAFAHVLYLYDRNTLVFTTFFEELESDAEDQLARIEAYMVDSFGEYTLDFHTIHLFGREISDLIPNGAIPLMAPRRLAPSRAVAS